MNPLDSVVARGSKEFGQTRIVRIDEVSEDVHLQIVHMRGDLNAWNKLHPYPRSFRVCCRQPFQGVVIGHSEDRNVRLFRQTDKFLRDSRPSEAVE